MHRSLGGDTDRGQSQLEDSRVRLGHPHNGGVDDGDNRCAITAAHLADAESL
jgi:hypothetical protein